MMVGRCEVCRLTGVWVNTALDEKGVYLGQYCAGCFERELGIGARRRPRTHKPNTKDDESPWQSNAIRALEEG